MTQALGSLCLFFLFTAVTARAAVDVHCDVGTSPVAHAPPVYYGPGDEGVVWISASGTQATVDAVLAPNALEILRLQVDQGAWKIRLEMLSITDLGNQDDLTLAWVQADGSVFVQIQVSAGTIMEFPDSQAEQSAPGAVSLTASGRLPGGGPREITLEVVLDPVEGGPLVRYSLNVSLAPNPGSDSGGGPPDGNPGGGRP